MEILNFITQHYAVISLLVYVLSGYIIYKLSANFVTRKEYEGTTGKVEELETCLLGFAKSIHAIETRLSTLPDGGAINQILLGIEELRGQQKALREVFEVSSDAQKEAITRLERQVDMLVTGHLDNK